MLGLPTVVVSTPSTAKRNKIPDSFVQRGVQMYVTVAGHTIEFEVFPSERELSSLVSVNGDQLERDPSSWPLAQGTAIQSFEPGLLTFDGPTVGKRLVIDMTNPKSPIRTVEGIPALASRWGLTAPEDRVEKVSDSGTADSFFMKHGLYSAPILFSVFGIVVACFA